MSTELESNVFNTALLFEGGSMRAAYTSAVVSYFLEQGLYFNMVYGVSAGSSNLVNYLSRNRQRAKDSFTTFMANPQVGDWKTFLTHKGLFNAHYIYQEAGQPEGAIPFDFDTFQANPANFCIPAYDRDTGEDLYFTRDDVKCLDDLMVRVRASSTLPLFMPPPTVNGHVCYDGGFAWGGGLPLRRIQDDGYERVVVIRTRKRGYRKEDSYSWAKAFFWRKPKIRDAMLTRSQRYNEACDLLDEWEKQGRAYVFYAEDLTLLGQERDVALLQQNFDAGYRQIQRDFPALLKFVQAGE